MAEIVIDPCDGNYERKRICNAQEGNTWESCCCECKPNFFWNGIQCVPPTECNCTIDGITYRVSYRLHDIQILSET